MNDLYGIDPGAPSNFRDFAQLMRVFESGQGRFIADFPMQWFSEIYAHMKSLTDLQHKQAFELWMRIGRNAVLPIKARFNPSLSWAENSVVLRDQVFKLIGATGCPAILEPLESALMDPNGFPDARGGHIPRTAEAYALAARPLLQTSPKIVLVDPYFRLRRFDERTRNFKRSDRHCKSLSALLIEATRWKRVEIFKLMISESEALAGDPEGDVFVAHLTRIASECGAGSIGLEWDVLDDQISIDRHPRYLLGMSSGLHFDWGFDTGDVNSTNHIEWMGKSVLGPLLQRFT